MLERHYLGLLHRLLADFPAVVVLGPRQCGKTTLVSNLVGWQLFDLERQSDFEQIANDPDLFFRLHPEKTRSLTSFVEEHDCAFGIVINNDERPRLYGEKLVGIPAAAL